MLSGTSNVDISGWLDNATVVQKKAVANYLNSNSSNPLADGDTNCDDPVALGFVELAIEAMLENGEVDWANEVILDSTFVSNEKTKCVYNKLKNLSNTVFNDIINDHFDSSKNAHIRFEVGNTPGGEDAVNLPYIGNPIDVSSTSNYRIVINSNIVNNLSTIELALYIIHESIHAELIERCFRLGLISAITFDNNGLPKVYFNSNPSLSFDTPNALYSALASHYYNNGQNSQWNHDLFTVGNYRTKMTEKSLASARNRRFDEVNPFAFQINFSIYLRLFSLFKSNFNEN